MSGRLRVVVYWVAGLFALLIALAVQAPASLLPKMLPSSEQGRGLALVYPQGTLWKGSAGLETADTRLGRLAWSLSPASLLAFSPAMDWRLEGTRLSGRLQAGAKSMRANAQGALELGHLTPILARYAIRAEGRLKFTDVSIAFDDGEVRVAGRIDWSGGRVSLGIGGWQGQELLPAMQATAIDSSHIVVTLWDGRTNAFLPAGRIEFLPDGWVKLGASGHLAQRFNQSLVQAEDPDAIVLSVEEQLF